MTYQLTETPDTPYYEGQDRTATETEQWYLPVSINGRGYIVDRSQQYAQFSRKSINLLNTQQAEGFADIAQAPPEVWRRTVTNWNQGEGQERFDRKESQGSRYWKSAGVDVWTKHEFSLLNKTAMIQALDDERSWVTTVGPNTMVVVNNLTVYWWDAPSGSIGAPDGSFALPSKAESVTTDGQYLYVLGANGIIYRYDTTAWGEVVFGTVPTFDASRALLKFIKGFLVAAGGNILYDMTSGTATTIYVHPIPDYIWRDGTDGMATGYLLGGQGDKWHTHALSIKEDATTFNPPTVAASLPEGEVGFSVASYLGYVMIGANTGWRFAIPDASGNLTFGQLVSTAAPVLCFEGQDRFVWFGLTSANSPIPGVGKSIDPRLDVERAALGRADLSVFTNPLTPAVAADLSCDKNGIVWSVTTFGATSQERGWRVFCVSGEGVYAEQNELVDEGWLEQGDMTFGSSDKKVGLYSAVFFDQLIGGGVFIDVAWDDDPYIEIGGTAVGGQSSTGNIQMNRKFDHAQIRYRLIRSESEPTTGPVVNRLEFRAVNVPGKATEWSIPLLLADDYGYDGAAEDRSVESDYDQLVSLVESRQRFVYREGQRRWQLYATDFQWLPTQLTNDGGTYQGVFVLTAKELR